MCVARVSRELLRGLTISSWEESPSPHTVPMLPPQAKLPIGEGPLEVPESSENVLGGVFGKGPPRLSGVSAKLPCGGGGVKGVPWEPQVSWT